MTTEDQKKASARRRERNRARGRDREAAGRERVRARPILKGTSAKITRSCHKRSQFLATGQDPEEMKNFYGYVVARALRIYGHEFHSGNQMFTHHHLGTTDVRGNRPGFKNSIHSCIARGLNAKRGEADTFWKGGGSCDTEQSSDEDILNDMVYDEVNPVVAGLVKWARRWPGFTSHGWKFGETRTFTRPDWFFDPDNPDNLEKIQITRVRPPIYPELSDDELYELLMQKVREEEIRMQKFMDDQGRRFMGEKKLAKQRWNARAKSWQERFGLVPRVSASAHWKGRAKLRSHRVWEDDYAEARAAFRNGENPVFPAGTYFLRVIYGVPVASESPQAPP